jgi:hypothetical protein
LSSSGRAVAWVEADLIVWQASRIAARNQEAGEWGVGRDCPTGAGELCP